MTGIVISSEMNAINLQQTTLSLMSKLLPGHHPNQRNVFWCPSPTGHLHLHTVLECKTPLKRSELLIRGANRPVTNVVINSVWTEQNYRRNICRNMVGVHKALLNIKKRL
jgi:hypothetical protein